MSAAAVGAVDAGQRITKEDAVLLVEKTLSPAISAAARQKKAVELVNRIERTDFAWRRGEVYEAGIPSFMTHILDRVRDDGEDGAENA